MLRARPLRKRAIQLPVGALESRQSTLSALLVPAQVPRVALGEMKALQTPHPFRAPHLVVGRGRICQGARRTASGKL